MNVYPIMARTTSLITGSLALCAALLLPATADAEVSVSASASVDVKVDILAAIELPVLTHEARVKGVAEADIKTTLTAVEKVSPVEARLVLEAEVESVEESGPVENFGTFVTAKVNAGLRGQALAAAIHAEHKARGIGKGKSLRKDKAGKKFKKFKKHKRHGKKFKKHKKHKKHRDGAAIGVDVEHGGHGKALGHDKEGKALGHDEAARDAEKAADKAADKAAKAADKAAKADAKAKVDAKAKADAKAKKDRPDAKGK